MIRYQLELIPFVVIIYMSTRVISSSLLPCEFHDSINITEGHLSDIHDESVTFNNITYGPNQFAVVDYMFDENLNEITTEPYKRGCICQIKKCIRTCCPYGYVEVNNGKGHTKCERSSDFKIPETAIQIMIGKEMVSGNDRFAIVYGKPNCTNWYKNEKYEIQNTGKALIDELIIHHSKYCINFSYNNETKNLSEQILYCDETIEEIPNEVQNKLILVCSIISIPFMIAALIINPFEKACGKLFFLYLAFHTVVVVLEALFKIFGHLGTSVCDSYGWIMYYAYFVDFLLMNVICLKYAYVKSYRQPPHGTTSDSTLDATRDTHPDHITNTSPVETLDPLVRTSLYCIVLAVLSSSLFTLASTFIKLIRFLSGSGTAIPLPEECITYYDGKLGISAGVLIPIVINGGFLFVMRKKIRELIAIIKTLSESMFGSLNENEKFFLTFFIFIWTGIVWIAVELTFSYGPGRESYIFIKVFEFFIALQGLFIFVFMFSLLEVHKFIESRKESQTSPRRIRRERLSSSSTLTSVESKKFR